MQVEDLLEMIACLRVFKLPNFEARGHLGICKGKKSKTVEYSEAFDIKVDLWNEPNEPL